MNLMEAKHAFYNLTKEFGIPEYRLDVTLNSGWKYNDQPEALVCRVSPEGYTNSRDDTTFYVYADDFDTLLEETKKAWDKAIVDVTKKKIRDMGIAIIRITADNGHCTDALLRRAEFSMDDIKKYAKRAGKEADSMASGGPFKVIFGESNGGPDV